MSSQINQRARIIELIFLGIAATASAFAALATSDSTRQTQKSAADHRRYGIRNEAMVRFNASTAEYDATLQSIKASLPIDIEERSIVSKATGAELEELRKIVAPIILARRKYRASFDPSIVPWPQNIRNMIVNAAKYGDTIGLCYEIATNRPLNDMERQKLRDYLNAKCRYLGNNYENFMVLNEEISDTMAKEIANAAAQLGADPDVMSKPRFVPNSPRQ